MINHKEANSMSSNSFWSRKISVWHFIYFSLICLIFILTTLVIMPGRINDNAYQNFSFAATITSIVLAVVSIIYSIQSGLSNVGQLNAISDIENKISHEISKFSDIDDKIRSALSPIASQVGDIKQTQDNLHTEFLKISKLEIVQGDNNNRDIEGPVILYVVLYAAAKSHETGMDLPYHKFAEYVGPQARYCEGLLDGIAAFKPDKIKVEQGSRSSRKKVTHYDNDTFGTVERLRQKVEAIPNTKLSNYLLASIDDYYSDNKNQKVQDSCD